VFDADAGTGADLELPAVAVADQALAIDEAIADPAAIVRALVRDDDDATALESRHGDRPCPIAGADHPPDRHIDFYVELGQLGDPVVRVVPELVV
jgi:hypothetical protein